MDDWGEGDWSCTHRRALREHGTPTPFEVALQRPQELEEGRGQQMGVLLVDFGMDDTSGTPGETTLGHASEHLPFVVRKDFDGTNPFFFRGCGL